MIPAERWFSKAYHSQEIRVGILLFAGLLSFGDNLHLSLLEGTEGLYAQITRELVATQDYLRLTHLGEPYSNKPPFYFWMVSLWTQLFGENEITLRLTSALFACGTMWLTYILGKVLFSSQVGFWAALVVASNHVFLWYGRRVLIDSTLTFFMALAIVAMVMGSRKGATSFWYFVAWIGMILASMVKGLHGFALPLALILVYSIWQKELGLFKSLWFWLGLGAYFAFMNSFYFLLDPSFQWHFDWQTRLEEAFTFTHEDHQPGHFKFYWYLYMLWFDFFPWSVLIPGSLLYVLSKRPFRRYPAEHLIWLWFLGFLLIMCLSRFRREPYLMPLVPSLGLLIGYYLVALSSTDGVPTWHRKLNLMAFGCLSGLFLFAFLAGPLLLNKKWSVPLDLFPMMYALSMMALCGFLVWATWKHHMAFIRVGLIGIGLGFTVGIVQYLLPAIDRTSSPRHVAVQVRNLAQNASSPMYYFGITQEDLTYYLNRQPPIPSLTSLKDLHSLIQARPILLVTDKKNVQRLRTRRDMNIQTLEEYPQPRGRNFLVLLITQTAAGTKDD